MFLHHEYFTRLLVCRKGQKQNRYIRGPWASSLTLKRFYKFKKKTLIQNALYSGVLFSRLCEIGSFVLDKRLFKNEGFRESRGKLPSVSFSTPLGQAFKWGIQKWLNLKRR